MNELYGFKCILQLAFSIPNYEEKFLMSVKLLSKQFNHLQCLVINTAPISLFNKKKKKAIWKNKYEAVLGHSTAV